jgi:hypothetical protein
MKPEHSMIVRNDAALTVSFTAEAEALKVQALDIAATIGRVTSVEEQAEAVKAQQSLQGILGQAEKARKACKEPVLDFGRKIDDAAKGFIQELKDEMARISTMVGTFVQFEQKRVQAEEQARNEKLLEIEREKARALAKAKTEAEVDAVQEHFNNKAAAQAPPPEPVARVEGQRVTQDWDIIVSDIHKLYRAYPTCVDLTARKSEIKNLLKQGITPPGVIATPVARATVTNAGQRAFIEV